MSAPNAGRQSPEPEQAPKQTQSTTAHAGDDQAKVDAAPSATHGQDVSEETKNTLESNPKGILEDAAHAKVGKEGRGDVA
ncbi:hypothetical protein MMC19_004030 [Ptychographa xylographoides]|nr:hypothetical protein [Ptychographa xylographoides]